MKWTLTSVVLVRRACFLRPEPNVTLNSARGVFLGNQPGGEGLTLKLVPDGDLVVGRLPGGPRTNWNRRSPGSHRSARMGARAPWPPGATPPPFCFTAERPQNTPLAPLNQRG